MPDQVSAFSLGLPHASKIVRCPFGRALWPVDQDLISGLLVTSFRFTNLSGGLCSKQSVTGLRNDQLHR